MKRVIILCLILVSLCAFGCTRQAERGAAPSDNAGAKAETADSEIAADGKVEAAEVKAEGADAKAESKGIIKYVDDAGQPLGLQLDIAAVLPGEVIEGAHQVMDNGIYRMTWIYNGIVSYSLERLPKAELGEDGVRAAFAEIAPFAYDASLRPDDDMTRRLGAVAWKWFYSTGKNEDLRTNTDYYIQRDDFDYRFSVSVPADFADENKQVVKSLVNGLVFVTR